MTTQEPASTRVCPQCGATITRDPGFVDWCPACDWNVDPESTSEPKLGWFSRRQARASAAASRRMYDDIVATGEYRDRTRTTALRAVAVLIHLLTVVLLALSLALITGVLGTSGPIIIVIGAVGLITGLFVQPLRPPPLRRRKPAPKYLTRTDAPTLFALTDEVARVIGGSGLDEISVDASFNAYIVRHRGRWRINLGLALWSVLSPAQRAGLIGHELGHQVNGDQRRESLVRTAINTMYRWAYLLQPPAGRTIHPQQGLAAIGEMLAVILMAPFAVAAFALARALYALSARQGMSAEYYADMLEARVAGTDAAVDGLEKLLLAQGVVLRLRRVGQYERDKDPWAEAARYIAEVPPNALERHRRAARRRLPAVDSTHPPTQLRADLLRHLPHEPGRVQLDAARMAAIDAELAPTVTRVTAVFHDRVRG